LAMKDSAPVNGISMRTGPNVTIPTSTRFIASESAQSSSRKSVRPEFSSLMGAPCIEPDTSNSSTHGQRGSGLSANSPAPNEICSVNVFPFESLCFSVVLETSAPTAEQCLEQAPKAKSRSGVHAVVCGSLWVREPAPPARGLEAKAVGDEPFGRRARSNHLLDGWLAHAELHDYSLQTHSRQSVASGLDRPDGRRPTVGRTSTNRFAGHRARFFALPKLRTACWKRPYAGRELKASGKTGTLLRRGEPPSYPRRIVRHPCQGLRQL
jgi:hypothetical protein